MSDAAIHPPHSTYKKPKITGFQPSKRVSSSADNASKDYGRFVDFEIPKSNDSIIRVRAMTLKYSQRVHTYFWAMVILSIVGIFLAIGGSIMNDLFSAYVSVILIALASIAGVQWIKKAKSEDRR